MSDWMVEALLDLEYDGTAAEAHTNQELVDAIIVYGIGSGKIAEASEVDDWAVAAKQFINRWRNA